MFPEPLNLRRVEKDLVVHAEQASAEPTGDGGRLVRSAWSSLHPEWDPEVLLAIEEGAIKEGMTFHQVVAAWGMPEKRWKFWLIALPRSEQWTYNHTDPRIQVTFQNATVRRAFVEMQGEYSHDWEVEKTPIGWLKQLRRRHGTE